MTQPEAAPAQARDPRREPHAGDVLRWPDGKQREVTRREFFGKHRVSFRDYDGLGLGTELKLWRRWAATAEVVRTAEAP